MALGARPEQIRNQFFSIALRLLAAGGAIGIFGAWLTGRALQSVLYHVGAFETAELAAAAAIVAAACLGACVMPARRAARMSPVQALADS